MINLKRVDSEYLKELYEKSNKRKSSRKYKGIKYYCTEPIVIECNKEVYVSKEWFINSHEELIYITEKNKYFNLGMYSNNKSFVNDVYIVERKEENEI